MFLKLVVLILVFGSSGVGLLSVRQSRLQAVHEMAEARHRIRRLNEQAGEIRTLIVQSSTPDRVHRMMGDHNGYRPATHHPARVKMVQPTLEEAIPAEEISPLARVSEPDLVQKSGVQSEPVRGDDGEQIWVDEHNRTHRIWVLEDGTRVVFIEE